MTGPRPFTRAQELQNRAFLRALRRSGNAIAAAREVDAPISTLRLRRRTHADFARRWDAALAVAQARLRAGWGGGPTRDDGDLRTDGGEPVIQFGKNGRLQLRAALPGRLTKAAEQAFLTALSVTANIRLAAAAAGASFSLFYRRRQSDPGFAREWRRALAEGYENIELALLARIDPCSFADDGWSHNERPETPPLTADQMIQLLYLHQKEVRLGGVPEALRRRRGETRFAHRARLDEWGRASQAAEYERYRVVEAAFRATGVMPPHEPPPPFLPDLSQVKGWSRAKPAACEAPTRPLFGGWRFEDGGKRKRR